MIPQLDDCMLEKSWKNNCGCYTLKEKMHLNVIQYVVTPSRVTILFLKSKFIFGVKILHQIIIDSGIICAPYRMPIFEFQFQKRKKPSFYFQNLAPKCLYLYWPPCWIDEVYKYLQKKISWCHLWYGLKIATKVLFINFYDPLLWFLILKLVDLIYIKNKIN